MLVKLEFIMKNITRFFVLSVLCLSALVSCSKEEQVQQGKKLQVTPDALFFTRAATSQTLELKTNASQWTATVSKNDWLEIDKTSGTGSCDIVVTVSENNKELRTATISFSATGYKTAVVNVTQHPVDELINPSATGLFLSRNCLNLILRACFITGQTRSPRSMITRRTCTPA